MLTKGAIGNLVNRYKAVLKKCNLINTFGSLAVASMLVLGGAGVASANYTDDDTYYIEAVGQTKDVTTADINSAIAKNRVTGGSYLKKDRTEVADKLTSNVTVKSGDFGKGIFWGGHYISGVDTAKTYTVTSTNLTVEDGVTVKQLFGGSGVNNSNGAVLSTDETHLTIKGGNFGADSNGGNCPELLVVAGDLVKLGLYNDKETSSSTLNYSNLSIEAGTFKAPVIGGSAAIQNYTVNSSVSVKVDKLASTKITGGTFYHPIVAGGMAYGNQANSIVSNAYIEISGDVDLKDNADIYAGGIRGAMSDLKDIYKTSNTVTKSTVAISNAQVKNVYGTNVAMYGTTVGDNWTNINYVPLDGVKAEKDFIKTNLTLTNVIASGDVFIPDGSVTLTSANSGSVDIKGTLTAASSSAVTVAGDGATNDAIGGDASKLANYITVTTAKDAQGNTFKLFEDETTVNLDAGTIVGAVSGTVTDGKALTTEKPNETNVAMADLPNINHMITRVEMNDLRKRMGDIRLLEGNTGVWARWDGGKLKGDSGLTNDFHKIQAGIDTTTGIDNLRLGAAFSYTNSDMEFAKADAESDTMSLAAYGVWTADNGMFADVIARLAFIDTEIQTDKVKGDLDNLAFSLSGEYGWRFDVCKSFFVEPQLELTYTYVDSDEFTSAGAKFDFDSTDSLIGRAGLAAGWKLPSELGELYARASVVQEFMGDSKLTASMGNTVRYYETDGDDTWFEYGVGANVKVTNNAYIFADVERTEGAEIDEEWRGTVGFRYSF